MSSQSQRTLGPMEVKRFDGPYRRATDVVQNLDRVQKLADIPLDMARCAMGDCIGKAIGQDPLKAYGDEGLMSKVKSGAKVPDYLAKIYANEDARQRLGLALLEGTPGVEIETSVRIKRSA